MVRRYLQWSDKIRCIFAYRDLQSVIRGNVCLGSVEKSLDTIGIAGLQYKMLYLRAICVYNEIQQSELS